MKYFYRHFFLLKISFPHYSTMKTWKTLTPILLILFSVGQQKHALFCQEENQCCHYWNKKIFVLWQCLYFSMFDKQTRLKLLPVKCFNSSQHPLKTADLWIFDSIGTLWQMGNSLCLQFIALVSPKSSSAFGSTSLNIDLLLEGWVGCG